MHGEALAKSVEEKKALPFTFRLERDLRNLQLYAPVDQLLTTPPLSQFCHFDRTGSCLPPYLCIGIVDMQIGEW